MTLSVVERYAVVRAAIERRGRRESDSVLGIPCTAIERGAELATNAPGAEGRRHRGREVVA